MPCSRTCPMRVKNEAHLLFSPLGHSSSSFSTPISLSVTITFTHPPLILTVPSQVFPHPPLCSLHHCLFLWALPCSVSLLSQPPTASIIIQVGSNELIIIIIFFGGGGNQAVLQSCPSSLLTNYLCTHLSSVPFSSFPHAHTHTHTSV